MNRIRKMIKVAMFVIIVFICMTAVLAALITYTSFDEDWSNAGMLVIVTIVCILTGYLIGSSFNSKGILVGLISSLITVEFIFLTVQLVFFREITDVIPNNFYLISVLFGTVGGIAGVNMNK